MVQKMPRCRGCGQAIQGSYVQALGADWHPEHFVCAHCQCALGTGQYVLHENTPYHVECYRQHIAPHCMLCGKPLVGRFHIDYWGTRYCSEHQQQYPRCSFCSRLVPPAQQKLDHGRIVCPLCLKDAGETVEEAKPLFRQVTRWFQSQGITFNSLPISLELCEQDKLHRLLGSSSLQHALGATTGHEYSMDGHYISSEVKGIAVLRGLPPDLFQGVAAHELGHVWFIVHGVRNLPSWVEEGWCELLAYRYHRYLDTASSRYYADGIERNPDPVYGDGFRRVLDSVNRYSFARLIEHFRTKKQLLP